MSTATEIPVVEEEGVSYVYCNDVAVDADDDTNRPVYIGTKRFAGLYCQACERALGLNDEKQARIARAVRKAEKTDSNIISACSQCNATFEDKKIILPCSSFDWHIPPHILERLLNYKRAAQIAKKTDKKKGDDDDDSDSDSEDDEPSKKKKNHKDTISQQKSSVRSASRPPRLSLQGHIEDQYGQVISVSDFFAFIINPCHVRLYDRIPKHFV